MLEWDFSDQRAVSMAVSIVVTESGEVNGEEPVNLWWHLNRKLIPMKLHWFLFFGSFSGVIPACIIYCTKVGMSMSEIGILYAVMPFIQFFSKIILGGIADKYRRHKTLLMTSIFCVGAFLISVNFMPTPSNVLRSVEWKPADDGAVECRRSLSEGSQSIGLMQLRLCDRNASNPYFAVLTSATESCNVSCDVHHFPFPVCEKGNINCFPSNRYRYSFHDTPKSDVRLPSNLKTLNDVPLSEQSRNYSSCPTLPITSVTFGGVEAATVTDPKMSLQVQLTGETMATRCHLKNAVIEMSVSCRVICIAKIRPSVYPPDAVQDKTLQYVWIWTAYLGSNFFFGSLVSTTDTIVLYLLDGRTEHFGKTRMFASFGWGLISPVIGLIVDKVSEGRAEKDYSSSFYLFGAFMLADFLLNIPIKVSIPHKSKELAKDVLKVLRRPPLILLMFAVFAQGMTTGFLWTFLVVYVNELSGGIQVILGLNYAFECFLSEMPLFAVSGWVISKIGHSYAITISLFASGLKTFLYSVLYNPWYILFIALVHGFSFSFLYAAMATYVNMVSPPGTAATFQGIFQGIFEGVDVASGNLIGGYTYERYGGRQTMMLFGVVTMGASVIHFVVARILEWIARRPSSDHQTAAIQLRNDGCMFD